MSIVFRSNLSIFLLVGNTADTLIGEIQMAVKEQQITMGQGLSIIRDTFTTYLDRGTLTREQADLIGEIVVSDLQLRDYLLGLAEEQDLDLVGAFLECLLSDVNPDYAHALLTILACYYIEDGAREQAWLALEEAEKLNGSYSLTQLIKRVYLSNGLINFAEMRKELHVQVLATITADSDRVIIE